MRVPRLLHLALLAIAATAALAADSVAKRECSFERAGRPAVQSRCVIRSAVLNGINDATIRMEDGKALHLEGPLAGEEGRYRLQGGFAHIRGSDQARGDGRAAPSCYERDDNGMTLCLGRTLD